MGLVFRGMLWCYCFTDFVKSLYCYCQNGGKQPKPWGVLMDKQNHPTFPYRPPNLLVFKWAKKKSSPAFANLWLLLASPSEAAAYSARFPYNPIHLLCIQFFV